MWTLSWFVAYGLLQVSRFHGLRDPYLFATTLFLVSVLPSRSFLLCLCFIWRTIWTIITCHCHITPFFPSYSSCHVYCVSIPSRPSTLHVRPLHASSHVRTRRARISPPTPIYHPYLTIHRIPPSSTTHPLVMTLRFPTRSPSGCVIYR